VKALQFTGAFGAAAAHADNARKDKSKGMIRFNFQKMGFGLRVARGTETTSSASLQRKISRRFASLSCGEGIGWPGSGVTEAGHRIKRRAISMSDEKTAQSPSAAERTSL
jgi:hypothetical protein